MSLSRADVSLRAGSSRCPLPPPLGNTKEQELGKLGAIQVASLIHHAGQLVTFDFFGKLDPLGICQRFLLFFNTFKIQNFTHKLDYWLCLIKRCCRDYRREKKRQKPRRDRACLARPLPRPPRLPQLPRLTDSKGQQEGLAEAKVTL